MPISCYATLNRTEEIVSGEIYKGILALDDVEFSYALIFRYKQLKNESDEEVFRNLELHLYDQEGNKRLEKLNIDDPIGKALTDPIRYSIDQYIKGVRGRCNYPFTEDRTINDVVKELIKKN